ncbi:MAG: hypothetical protein WC829_18825 [Hyphomicrobium sp.]|jgi:hypothetical protein
MPERLSIRRNAQEDATLREFPCPATSTGRCTPHWTMLSTGPLALKTEGIASDIDVQQTLHD